jgi:uncharacterized protein with HEPN domain
MTATDRQLLSKMLVHIDEVTEDVGDLSYEELIDKKNRTILKSAAFDVAQIFELAKGTTDKHQSLKLTPETYDLIDGVYMKALSKTRAVAVHRYETLNPVMFWGLLKDGLPPLRKIIENLLNSESNDDIKETKS